MRRRIESGWRLGRYAVSHGQLDATHPNSRALTVGAARGRPEQNAGHAWRDPTTQYETIEDARRIAAVAQKKTNMKEREC